MLWIIVFIFICKSFDKCPPVGLSLSKIHQRQSLVFSHDLFIFYIQNVKDRGEKATNNISMYSVDP